MSTPALEYLKTRIDLLEQQLVICAGRREDRDTIEAEKMTTTLRQELAELEHAEHGPQLPVTRLREEHGLNPFEIDVLFLAVGAQLDGYLGELAAHCTSHSNHQYISPWLAATLFCERRIHRLEAMRSLDPDGRLAQRGLVRVQPHPASATDNPMYHEIVPAPFLSGFVRGERVVGPEVASVGRALTPELGFDEIAIGPEDHRFLMELKTFLSETTPEMGITAAPGRYDFARGTAMLLTSPKGSGKTLTARAFARELGLDVLEVDCERLAALPWELAQLAMTSAFAEAAFWGECLILDEAQLLLSKGQTDQMSGVAQGDALAVAAFNHCVRRYPVFVLLTSEAQADLSERVEPTLSVQYHLSPMTTDGCNLAWQLNLPANVQLAPDVDFGRLTELYTLTGRSIQNALSLASHRAPDEHGVVEVDQAHLDACARIQQNTNMSQVVKRTRVNRSRKDLLLPPELSRLIDELIETERIRETVLNEWDLARKFQKGLGMCCLFDGEPGTGKTLTAEVVASELDMPMYTVNISYVVSKYIGETEKNLQRIFDEGSKGRCLLLFDEADTLFSKRTKVTSSIDRFSNMEIGLLLQLIENYRGLVVLTTNLKSSIDSAFNRRFSYKLKFPMPGPEIRKQIWERHLPMDRLDDTIDLDALAKDYEVSGGSIRTISLRSAYRAALHNEGRISQEMLVELLHEEMRSLGRLIRG